MVKIAKLVTLLLIILTSVSVILYGIELQIQEARYAELPRRETFFGDNLYASNRYAQKETIVTHTFDSTIDPAYELIATDDVLALYYEPENYRFIIKNTTTQYVWHSFAPDTEIEDLNSTMEALLTAPFYIEYFPYNTQTERLSTTTRREVLTNVSIVTQSIPKGIRLAVDYRRLDIQFDLEVYLEDGSLVAHVPADSIVENQNLLYSIQILPNFGSTLKDDTPGYMLIPDGPGALYRFKDNTGKQALTYLSRYYGVDYGIKIESNLNPLNQLTLPIFGIVHGINQHAFIGIVESGDAHANFLMSPAGANGLNYNLTGTQFILRETFVFPTNLKGDGIPSIIEKRYGSDLTMRYLFSEPNQSNYVGLARLYQQYLVETGMLTKQHSTSTQLRLEVLQSDSERGLFGMNTIAMTTFNQTQSIIENLKQQGVDMTVILKGWNAGGLSGQMPYDMDLGSKLGSNKDFKALQAYTQAEGIRSYLYGDYTKTYDHSDRVNERDDYARGVYRRIMQQDIQTIVYNNEYYLYPTTSKRLMLKDQNFYENHGTLALDSTALLFSYFKGSTYYDRTQSITDYQSALSNYGKIGLYQPNAYLFGSMQAYFDVPMYNAQFTFYDDTIPFLQIVLSGYIDLFAPLQNFFASSIEQTLMLIDFGMYPSYLVTEKPTHLLKFTQANRYYSTAIETWETDILDTYQMVSEALDLVVGQSIAEKVVLENGVTKTTYDNGIYFIVNYTEDDYINGSTVIPAKSYYVGGQS